MRAPLEEVAMTRSAPRAIRLIAASLFTVLGCAFISTEAQAGTAGDLCCVCVDCPRGVVPPCGSSPEAIEDTCIDLGCADVVKCGIDAVCGEGDFADCPTTAPAPALGWPLAASLAALFAGFGTWRLRAH
jgi:hypothetical protein